MKGKPQGKPAEPGTSPTPPATYRVEVFHYTGTDYVVVARNLTKEAAQREARSYANADARDVRIVPTPTPPAARPTDAQLCRLLRTVAVTVEAVAQSWPARSMERAKFSDEARDIRAAEYAIEASAQPTATLRATYLTIVHTLRGNEGITMPETDAILAALRAAGVR